MDIPTLEAYADAALALHFPSLDADSVLRVKAQLSNIARLAAPVLAFPLDASDEPAPVYRP